MRTHVTIKQLSTLTLGHHRSLSAASTNLRTRLDRLEGAQSEGDEQAGAAVSSLAQLDEKLRTLTADLAGAVAESTGAAAEARAGRTHVTTAIGQPKYDEPRVQ
jgi:chromosome segregation ATPase